jgi:hypothetical protein
VVGTFKVRPPAAADGAAVGMPERASRMLET